MPSTESAWEGRGSPYAKGGMDCGKKPLAAGGIQIRPRVKRSRGGPPRASFQYVGAASLPEGGGDRLHRKDEGEREVGEGKKAVAGVEGFRLLVEGVD